MEKIDTNSPKDEFEQFASFLPENLGEFEERFTAKMPTQKVKSQKIITKRAANQGIIPDDINSQDLQQQEFKSQVKLFSNSNAPWHQNSNRDIPKISPTTFSQDIIEEVQTTPPAESGNTPEESVLPEEITDHLDSKASIKTVFSFEKYWKKLFNFKNISVLIVLYMIYHFAAGMFPTGNAILSNASIASSSQPKAITLAYQEVTSFANTGRSYTEFTTTQDVITIKKEGSIILVYRGNGSCWFAGMVGAINAAPASDPTGEKCSDKQISTLRK